ncbi:hypothetical protein M5K25_008394 [Dendrobium thyrsiflorum]|uniref:Uncharacterized protein n=1 Tax=Dendrobium thyrsiflorum TaxID=117978 RepID=A0ABD0V8B4_DENTH
MVLDCLLVKSSGKVGASLGPVEGYFQEVPAAVFSRRREIADFEFSKFNFGNSTNPEAMAAKKVDALEERLEGEMNQIKTTVEERLSSMEGQVADLRDMIKKMLEVHNQTTASIARSGEGRSTNSEIRREEEEVEIMEGERRRPHLEPIQREEREFMFAVVTGWHELAYFSDLSKSCRIKKNGVMFHDIVKFCGSQNEEKCIQSRQIPAFNNRILAIMYLQVDSQGDGNDKDLFNRSTVHVETPPSEQMNEHCERKHFNKLQGSNNTLAITDSQGDSQGDEENVGLHGNIEHKETTSYKMGSEYVHFTKAAHDTLAIKDSQRNSLREEDDVLHGNTAQKEATSNEMMNTKYKRRHSNNLQA